MVQAIQSSKKTVEIILYDFWEETLHRWR